MSCANKLWPASFAALLRDSDHIHRENLIFPASPHGYERVLNGNRTQTPASRAAAFLHQRKQSTCVSVGSESFGRPASCPLSFVDEDETIIDYPRTKTFPPARPSAGPPATTVDRRTKLKIHFGVPRPPGAVCRRRCGKTAA